MYLETADHRPGTGRCLFGYHTMRLELNCNQQGLQGSSSGKGSSNFDAAILDLLTPAVKGKKTLKQNMNDTRRAISNDKRRPPGKLNINI